MFLAFFEPVEGSLLLSGQGSRHRGAPPANPYDHGNDPGNEQ